MLGEACMQFDTDSPIRIDSGVRAWMLKLGYVHESELEEATSTTPRSRRRWKSPAYVTFGNERWYPLAEIKHHLEARAAEPMEDGREARK
jgi:hypothetical protein